MPPEASVDQTTAYAQAVAAGDIVAGPHVRAAVKRHLDDLRDGAERGLRFDTGAAQRAIGFFRDVLTVEVEEQDDLGHVESRSVPFVLQPWQCFIVGSLFGWKNQAGFRRFRRAYVEIAKGNGKSPMAAGIGHYMLAATGKLKAEVYSAASALDQAEILFRDAVSMYQRSPALRRRIRASGTNPVRKLSIINPQTRALDGFFRPISAEKKGKSGPRPYCALIDEVHEHPDNNVIEMMRAGTKGNQEALIFEITNSGFDPKSVCGLEHEYAVKVAHGEVENDAWFTFIASLDEGDDPFKDEACWIKANPNLGVSIQKPYIREQVAEAVGMPSKAGLVKRLHFCIWTESDATAISREVWMACQAVGEKAFDPEELTARGVPCFGGLDLSQARDLVAFSLVWLLDPTPDLWRFAMKTWFWTPKDTLADRVKTDRAPYDTWVDQGFMEAIPGKRISYAWVADALAGLCAEFHPLEIAGDQYGLERLQEHLDDIGVSLPLQVHPQGFQRRKIGEREAEEDEESGADDIVLWMPDSILKFEAALLEERVAVEPNPVMTMCAAGTVYAENRTGHRMFDKAKATTRIDGMVSGAMGIGMATAREVSQPSVYRERGILVV